MSVNCYKPLLVIFIFFLSVYNGFCQLPVTSGLKLHLDAASGYNSNGSLQSTWQDLSSSGNNMISGAGSREPTYINNVLSTGFAGVQFDGVDDYMINQTLNTTFSDTQATLVVVRIGGNIHATGVGGAYRCNISIADDSSYHEEMGIGSDWGLHHTYGGNWEDKTHPCYDSLPSTKPVIISTILGKQPTDIAYFLNGSQSSNSPFTQGSPLAYSVINRRIIIGGRFQGSTKTSYIAECFSGYLLEVLAYNRKLTVAEMVQVDTYLVHKYYSNPGFTLTGDTVCAGHQAHLTYTNPGGSSSASITYSDGTNTYTQTVQNGVPFVPANNPTVTTTYSMGAATLTACTQVRNPAFVNATIVIDPAPTISVSNDTNVCSATTILLHSTTNGTYNWYKPSTANPTSSSQSVSVVNSTTFYLEAILGNCRDTDSVKVTVLPLPIANAGNDTSLCVGTTIQLHGSGGLTYSWLPANAFVNPLIATPILTVANTGTYSLIVTNSYNCRDTDSVNIMATPRPIANAGNDTFVCINSQINLLGSGGGNYLWFPSANVSNPAISNPSILISGSTILNLEVTNSTGCKDTDQIAITVLPVNVNAGADTSGCLYGTVQLHGTGNGSFSWSPLSLFNNPLISNPIVTIKQDSTYTLTVTNAIGCKDSDKIHVSLYPNPVANAGPDTSICQNASIQLHGSGGNTFLWYPSAGLSNAFSSSPIATVTKNMTYYMVVKNVYGCADTDQVSISIIPITADAGRDTVVCKGSRIQLHGIGNGTYSWYPNLHLSNSNISDPIVFVSDSERYYLVVTNSAGCKDTDDVIIRLFSDPVFNISPHHADLCIGDSLQITASGADVYYWWPDSNSIALSDNVILVYPDTNMTYFVAVKDTTCGVTDTVGSEIIVRPLPKLILSKSNDISCSNAFAQLHVTGADKYVWSPELHIDNRHSPDPIVHPSNNIRYTVLGTTNYGCFDTAGISIDFKNEGNAVIIVPNAFTPNGDGKNDCFSIKANIELASFELHIFNRWGQEVFRATNINDCWDGTFHGEVTEIGNYYYYYKIKTKACGDIFNKGDLILIK